MNYEKLYFQFIEKFKTQTVEQGVYTEKHHIIPKHAGGTDDPDNLVKLTFRQHIFIHRLRWKAFGEFGDYLAYKWMSGYKSEHTRFTSQHLLGKKRAAEGWMDRIRPLANNETQRRKARETGRRNVESGHLERIRKIARKVRAERKAKRIGAIFKSTDEKYKDSPEKLELFHSRRNKPMKQFQEACEKASKEVINTALRNEEFLHKTSSQSKYFYISPENLKFETVKYAAAYYGNVKPYRIENWCKRNQFGWKRILKTDVE